MKIVFFTDTFYPAYNGIVSSVTNLANGLTSLGHQVLICAPRVPKPSQGFLSPKVRVEYLPSIKGPYPDFYMSLPSLKLKKIVSEFGPDILHSHFPLPTGRMALRLSKALSIPVVTTVHTRYTNPVVLDCFGFRRFPGVKTVHQLLSRQYIGFLRKHDLVLVPGRQTANDLEEFGFNEYEIFASPVAYAQIKASASQGKKLSYQSLKAKGINLLYVGRISGEKNLLSLVQLYSQIHAKLANTRLILIGDGPYLSILKKEIALQGMEEQVVVVGAVGYKDLISKGYYHLGDVFVTLSEFETQGLSTLEAMSAGLPIIATAGSAAQDFAANAGIFVDLPIGQNQVDQAIDFLEDQIKLKRASKQAQEIASSYSEVSKAKELVELYQKVL